MKDKQFNPARNNEHSPAPGLAAVNTHQPEEEPVLPDENENHHMNSGDAERIARENEGNRDSTENIDS
jgi:hypothetical protein